MSSFKAVGAPQNHQAQSFAGLTLQGMRVGPMDPKKKDTHVVGLAPEAKTVKNKDHFDQTIFKKKERTGFSGGFKIPEEVLQRKLDQKKKKKLEFEDDDEKEKDSQLITREEILAHLNLGGGDTFASGKYGASGRAGITKEIIEGLEKDLEKLKRAEDNYKNRMHFNRTGINLQAETDEDREKARIEKIKTDAENEGGYILHADEKRLQILRHQVGQLNSLKNIDLDDLEELRMTQSIKLKELEAQYYGKQESQLVGQIIRRKLGFGEDDNEEANQLPQKKLVVPSEPGFKFGAAKKSVSPPKFEIKFGAAREEAEQRENNFQKKKRVQIVEPEIDADRQRTGQQNISGSILKKPSQSGQITIDQSHSRSVSEDPRRSRSRSQPATALEKDLGSPRRQVFEAKYDKYLANKAQKITHDKKAKVLEPQKFDLVTRNSLSPNRNSRNFQNGEIKQHKLLDQEELIPEGFEEHLMRVELLKNRKEDPFRLLGVTSEDKMSFFLLKWVFNAVKVDSDPDDKLLQGKPYVAKKDLCLQLKKNPELLNALNFTNTLVLEKQIKNASSAREGIFSWSDFLDFFFIKDKETRANFADYDRQKYWWNQIDQDGKKAKPKVEKDLTQDIYKINENEIDSEEEERKEQFRNDLREIPMTPQLKVLMNARHVKTEQEVEEDFNNHQKLLHGQSDEPKQNKKKNKNSITDLEDPSQIFAESREKAELLLLPSQIQAMKDVFERMDKYKDFILKRSDFLMGLRTDDSVVDFIDTFAIKTAKTKKNITLDQVLMEIEQDEVYEQRLMQSSGAVQQVNHKQFMTWREFISYFDDYQDNDTRNRKANASVQAREHLKKRRESPQKEIDPQEEMKTLLQQELERRLKELPRMRPADQIDITEPQLVAIKEVYDQTQKNGKVDGITFFLATKRHPHLRVLTSTLARDPEGTSRIPKETFQQVFDRMEHEQRGKLFDWPTIVEYFTKRGKPLTKEEIKKLQAEEQQLLEEEKQNQRKLEEKLRRQEEKSAEARNQEEDFETYQARLTIDGQEKVSPETKDTFEELNSENDRNRSDEDFDRDEDDDDDQDEDEENDEYRVPGLMYSRSAKELSRSDSHLKHQRLNGQDYEVARPPSKKGRYGVTVPKSFTFEIRDQVRPKSIRERKIQRMIAEKEAEEEDAIKYRLRPKPIPPEVLQPRFHAIQQAQFERQMRVKQECQQITKAREAPFSFYEREKNKVKPLEREQKQKMFKANPIPKSCSVLMFNPAAEEVARKKRIKELAESKLAQAAMPSRMKQDLERRAALPPKLTVDEDCTFKPKIGEMKTAEDFQAQHKKFEEQLKNAKKEMSTTKPASPNFTKVKARAAPDYLNQPDPVDKFKEALLKSQRSLMQSQTEPAVKASSTRATALALQKRRDELEAKKLEEEELKAQEVERLAKSEQMKQALGGLKQKVPQAIKEQRLKEAKAAMRQDEAATQAKIQETIQKARERPMLMESYDKKSTGGSNLQKLKAMQKFINVLNQDGEQ